MYAPTCHPVRILVLTWYARATRVFSAMPTTRRPVIPPYSTPTQRHSALFGRTFGQRTCMPPCVEAPSCGIGMLRGPFCALRLAGSPHASHFPWFLHAAATPTPLKPIGEHRIFEQLQRYFFATKPEGGNTLIIRTYPYGRCFVHTTTVACARVHHKHMGPIGEEGGLIQYQATAASCRLAEAMVQQHDIQHITLRLW